MIQDSSLAVFYLCRVADPNWKFLALRFLSSYLKYLPGSDHVLYVIYKGVSNNHAAEEAEEIFKSIKSNKIFVDDDGYDIGAYIKIANLVNEKYVLFLNSYSQILSNNWLYKMRLHLNQDNIKLVGASASYESLDVYPGFPKFPNPHIRTNGFLIERELFVDLTRDISIKDKMDAMLFESGNNSLTRLILKVGDVCIVGRNGRSYCIDLWPESNVFKCGLQENLLISDNQTDAYLSAPYFKKQFLLKKTWYWG